MSSGGLPAIDVVIPALNEEDHLGRCLGHTLSQDYPRELVRVLVVDSGSTDRTAAVASEWAQRDGRVSLVRSEHRLTTPEALNFGIARSTAEIVARVDAHGYPEPDFLSRAATALIEGGEGVACVGGRPLDTGETAFARAFTLARGSRFGVGGSVYAASDERQLVDTVPWGAYRRAALAQVGGFDPAMNHGEDEELNWRLRKAGHGVLFDPAIRFRYVPRTSLAAVYRQYTAYGRARVRVVAAHPDFLKARHLAPGGLVLALALLALLAPLSTRARRILAAALLAYAAAALGSALAVARADLSLTPRVATCFAALHGGYGVGTLREAVAWISRPRSQPQAKRGPR